MHNIIIICSAYRNIKINIMRSYRTISIYYIIIMLSMMTTMIVQIIAIIIIIKTIFFFKIIISKIQTKL